MKKNVNVCRMVSGIVTALVLLTVCVGCAGTPKTADAGLTPKETNTMIQPTRQVVLDWSDRSLGQEQSPAWLKPLVINKNPAPFRQAMGLSNDTIIKYAVFTDKNRNVAGTVALVQFNASLTRELRTDVLQNASAIMDRGEFEATNEAALTAKATLTGVSTAAEFWQLVETEDLETKQKTQVYIYYIVYAIPAATWDSLSAKFLLDVVGKIPESKTQQKAASMLAELKAGRVHEKERAEVRSDDEWERDQRARELAANAQIARDERTDRTNESIQLAQINQQAALRSGDPARIAAATTTPADRDYVTALRLAAGVL